MTSACAATIWPQLLGMGFKDLFGKPVMVQLSSICEHSSANMESRASQLRSMVEYSGGFGNLSRSFARRSFKAASLDKKYHDSHDVLTSAGLQLWLLCAAKPAHSCGLPLNAAHLSPYVRLRLFGVLPMVFWVAPPKPSS